jgi:hypothetical protein
VTVCPQPARVLYIVSNSWSANIFKTFYRENLPSEKFSARRLVYERTVSGINFKTFWLVALSPEFRRCLRLPEFKLLFVNVVQQSVSLR